MWLFKLKIVKLNIVLKEKKSTQIKTQMLEGVEREGQGAINTQTMARDIQDYLSTKQNMTKSYCGI